MRDRVGTPELVPKNVICTATVVDYKTADLFFIYTATLSVNNYQLTPIDRQGRDPRNGGLRDDLSLNNFAKIETQYALGIETIVTGVETAAQLAKLNALECQYGQGYFFAKPINQDAVGTLISSQLQPVRSVDN